MINEEKFYVIEVIGTKGEIGFIIARPNHQIEICVGGIVGDIAQFKTARSAKQFVKNNCCFNKGVSVHIRDNEYLMDYYKGKGLKTLASGDYVSYLENKQGQKLFYDTLKDEFYWDSGDLYGFACWSDESEIKLFVESMNFDCDVIIKRTDNLTISHRLK